GRTILGGVEYTHEDSGRALRGHRVQRDGIVELSEMSCRSEAEKSNRAILTLKESMKQRPVCALIIMHSEVAAIISGTYSVQNSGANDRFPPKRQEPSVQVERSSAESR